MGRGRRTQLQRAIDAQTFPKHDRIPSLLVLVSHLPAESDPVPAYDVRGSAIISSNGLGSSSEYLSTTYSCSPDRDMIRAPSQQRVVERRVSFDIE